MHDVSRRSFLAAAGGLSLASFAPSRFRSLAQGKIKPGPETALLVVDVQNCFIPGGTPARSRTAMRSCRSSTSSPRRFENVVLTQDWHTPGHVSFASRHAGQEAVRDDQACPTARRCCGPTTACRAPTARRCTRTSTIPHAQLIIRKGYHQKIDSYSAFIEADGKTQTGLAGYLKARGIKTIFVAGLATDFCVAWTAIDARKARLRRLRHRGRLPRHRHPAARWRRPGTNMEKAGVKRIQSTDLALGV